MTITPKEHLRQLKILHLSLLAGMVLILIMLSSFVVEKLEYALNNENLLFYLIGFILVINGIVTGEFLFNKLKTKINVNIPLADKMEGYRSAYIIRDALREAAGLFNIIFFAFMESNILFLVGAIFIIITFIATIPSQGKTISDLNLTKEEGDQLI